MNYTQKALEYHKAGLVIIPHWDFKIFASNWKQYQSGQTEQQVRELFSKDCTGIALVCTGGIEVIDVDVKHDPVEMHLEYFDYLNLYDPDILQKSVVIQQTKNKGYHLIYRTHEAGGNEKLARVAGQTEAYLETRGKGGLLFIDPSPGYSIKRGSLLNIPTISDRFRNLLIKCARELDQGESQPEKYNAEPNEKPQTQIVQSSSGQTPWDAYNERHEVLDLLLSDGWEIAHQRGKLVRLTRPGGTSGNCHGVILQAKDGKNVFYPWTTSTQFEAGRCYNAYAAYTLIHHNGDFSASARALHAKGYGDGLERTETKSPVQDQGQEGKTGLEDLIKKAEANKYDYNKPPKEIDYIFRYNTEGQAWDIAGAGMIGAVVGKQKSMKSTLVTAIVGAALSKREQIGFSFDIGKKKILSFDTEQPDFYFHQQCKSVHRLAGVYDNHPQYHAFKLRDFTKTERIEVIDYYLKMTDDIGLVIIDGLIDLCSDFNDNKVAEELMQRVMSWTDQTGALCICVLHLTKGQGFMRGHLGTELQNKCDFSIETELTSDGFAKVVHRDARTPRFPNFEFTRNNEGLPVLNHNELPNIPRTEEIQSIIIPSHIKGGDLDDVPF